MRAYLLSRLAQTVLVVFLSLTAVFFLVRLGGDPVLLFLPMDIQAKDLNEFRQRLGFNDPLPVQYGRFVAAAARGDFGESLRYKQDALRLVLERLPATLALAGAGARADLLRRHSRRRDLGDAPRARSSTTSGWAAPCSARPCPGSGSGSC